MKKPKNDFSVRLEMDGGYVKYEMPHGKSTPAQRKIVQQMFRLMRKLVKES